MIKTTRSVRASLLIALLVGAGSAVSLLAQGPDGPPPGGGEHHHGPPPNLLFEALDTNHDGVISADEMTNAPAALKGMLKNGATELKREDLRPPRPAPPATDGAAATDKPAPGPDGAGPKHEGRPGGPEGHHGPPPNLLFDAIDTNHDNVISADEMAAAPAALKSLLKNGATELKREDVRPPRPPQPPQD